MIERFFPSNESFLIGSVNESDLYGYIFNGFALVNINGENKYVSFDFQKPQIWFLETPEIKEIFRQKDADKNNISSFIKLIVRLNGIRIRKNGNSNALWEKVTKELNKEEFRETVANYKNTINSVIEKMFPDYNS